MRYFDCVLPRRRRRMQPNEIKKVAFVTSQLILGGGERQLLRTARCFSDHGVDVLVLSTNPGRDAVEAELGEAGSDAAASRITVIDLNEQGWIPRFRAARQAVLDFDPDLLIGWLMAATIWGPALALTTRVPIFRLAERNSWASYSRPWRVLRLMASWIADRVVANSPEAASEWHRRASWVDVRTARNFPPPYDPVATTPDGPVTLVLVGRLVRQKGIDVAIDALAIARRRGLDAKMVVVGRDFDSGVTAAIYRDRAEAAGISDYVEWREPNLKSVREASQWAQVLIAPSRWEGDSNVVSEALACGMGVVASDAVTPPAGTSFPQAPVDDADALADLLVSRAWKATSVDAETWAESERLAAEESLSAWLDLVI